MADQNNTPPLSALAVAPTFATMVRRKRRSSHLFRLAAPMLGAFVLVGRATVFVAGRLPQLTSKSPKASLQLQRPGLLTESNPAAQQPSCLGGCATGLVFVAAAALWTRGRKAGRERQALHQGSSNLNAAAETLERTERDEEQEEQFRALCTTLLRQVGTAENILAQDENSDGVLDFAEFQKLLKRLKFDCEQHQARSLFDMLDSDKSGTVDVSEMKMSLRSSGIIEGIYKEGFQNTLYTLVPAVALAVGFAVVRGPSAGVDFVTAYLVEDSLSVDNLFVFLAIFQYFNVSPALQKTCLDLGIYGAVVLRFLFIFAGLAAVQSFKPVLLLFAAVLIYASYTALVGNEDEEDDDDDEGPPPLVRQLLSSLPTTKDFVGDKLWIQDPKDGFLFTPLFTCIVAIELSDILFAVDSVPAVFAVTDDALIVYTSNILAILGLRSLYQVLSIAAQDLVYLETSAAVILGFVGLKLVAEVAGFNLDSSISLAVIVGTLAIGIVASKLEESEKQEPKKVKTKNSVERFLEDLGKSLGL